MPQQVETFFSCLDSNNRNDWLSIAEFNLERRVTQGALGEDPTGGDGGDAPLLEFEDLGKVD